MSKSIPSPTFFFVDEDGDMSMEWLFGAGDDRWRLNFFHCKEGVFLWKTSLTSQQEWSGKEAITQMASLIGEDSL